MNATIESPATSHKPIGDSIKAACQRIPPLWSLRNFVAVNPFLGLTSRHFCQAARLVQKVGHGEMLMPAQFYIDLIEGGRIQERDFHAAVKLAEKSMPSEWAEQIDFASLDTLKNALKRDDARPGERILSFAELVDARLQTGWAAFIVEEISKWCSAYYDQGQSSWRMPWGGQGLFAAWKAAARLDANPELTGLAQFRAVVDTLPDTAAELIEQSLHQLGVKEEVQTDFLHRQFMTVPGWSSYVQYEVREKQMAGGTDDSLTQLLAIRLVYDLALFRQYVQKPEIEAHWRKHLASLGHGEGISPGLLARVIAQYALETAGQTDWVRKLKRGKTTSLEHRRKTMQAVFCIDVRSEVFRRALEAQSSAIATIGFAGFFGMAIEYLRFGQATGGSQCPVLLTPKFRIRESLRPSSDKAETALLARHELRRTLNGTWNSFKTSAISCFSFVETAGLWFAVKLAKASLGMRSAELGFASRKDRQFGPSIECEKRCLDHDGPAYETGLALADQIDTAAAALKNMGLVSDFAKVVLICGHGSATTNNPYGSALDCGACGGHAGDANARVAAEILNKPEVRQGLKQRGIGIPDDTVFVAGLHNTTTDEVVIYDDESLSAEQSAEVKQCRRWLAAASKQARRERAPSLGLRNIPDTQLDEMICARSRDWSEVRPEWGLAGNAAFIAAPRERTYGLNLEGRAFLHNYDASLDPGKSTLELILIAPMVVASWINLQYYGSTVDNRLFGSGNKVLHNVVGTFGVWQGNGGDLQAGLPWQSVHDGTRLRHEPVRLSVFVEARREDLDAVLQSHPDVCHLVDNGWIHLFAIEPRDGNIWRRLRDLGWEEAAG